MTICVCLKQVPARDSTLTIAGDQGWVESQDTATELNEPDAYALEEALRLKEEHGGEVVAVTAGPSEASSVLREALAKGADRAILIEDAGFERADALATGRALAAAIRSEKPDLVLTGLQSDDAGHGQVGVIVAELLGLPHSTIIMSVEVDNGTIRVKRELEAGWFERIEMPLPAALAIQSGINKVRYATLMGIKKARKKPLDRKTATELGVDSTPGQRIQKLYPPEKSKQTTMLAGTATEQAHALIQKLRFEDRVL